MEQRLFLWSHWAEMCELREGGLVSDADHKIKAIDPLQIRTTISRIFAQVLKATVETEVCFYWINLVTIY